MKDILRSVLVMAGALALSGAAVFLANDTSTFVPPPESTAEDFARGLARRRYTIAWRQLSPAARQREREPELRARFEPVIADIGKINTVDARAIAAAGDAATAAARIDGSRQDVLLTLRLTRENGLWMVEQWAVAGSVE